MATIVIFATFSRFNIGRKKCQQIERVFQYDFGTCLTSRCGVAGFSAKRARSDKINESGYSLTHNRRKKKDENSVKRHVIKHPFPVKMLSMEVFK